MKARQLFEQWLTKKTRSAEELFQYAFNRSQLRLQSKSNQIIEKNIKRKGNIILYNGLTSSQILKELPQDHQ